MMNKDKSKHRDQSVVVVEAISLVCKSITSSCLYTVSSTTNLNFEQGKILTEKGVFDDPKNLKPENQSSSGESSFVYQLV